MIRDNKDVLAGNVIADIKAKYDATIGHCVRCNTEITGVGSTSMCQPCSAHISATKSMIAGRNKWTNVQPRPMSEVVYNKRWQDTHTSRITLPRVKWIEKP